MAYVYWTYGELVRLRHGAGQGFSLSKLAQSTGHTREACDLALWALFGRSVTDAQDILNGRALAEERIA